MVGRTCNGCGRLLGLRAPIECPCWTSVNDGATIPERLKPARVRVIRALKAASENAPNAPVLVRYVNEYLRAGLS